MSELMPLLAHLNELRRRLLLVCATLVVTWTLCYWQYMAVMRLVFYPYRHLIQSGNPLVVTGLIDGFSTKMSVSFWIGAVLAFPVLIYHIVRYIVPALGRGAKWRLFLAIGASFGLAIMGGWIGFGWLIPLSIRILTSHEFIPPMVRLMLRYPDAANYILTMTVYSILVFQFPILLEYAMANDWVTRKALMKSGRYVIVVIFIVAAIVTPPDVVSQLSIAIPMIVLFYGTILVAKLAGWGSGGRSVCSLQ